MKVAAFCAWLPAHLKHLHSKPSGAAWPDPDRLEVVAVELRGVDGVRITIPAPSEADLATATTAAALLERSKGA